MPPLLQSFIKYEFVNPPPAYFKLDQLSGNITVAKSVFYDIEAAYVVSSSLFV